MTQLRSDAVLHVGGVQERRRRWPLVVAATGLLGLLVPVAPAAGRAGTLLTTGAVAMLLLSAAGWRRWVEPRVRTSTAAALVPLGLVVSAASLVHRSDWVGWLGVSVAATALAWMALRERTVSRWIGVLSLVPAPVTTLASIRTDVAGAADVAGPAWLLVAGLGLALGRSTITR